MGCVPQLISDDLKRRKTHANPLSFGPGDVPLDAPLLALTDLVPYQLAAIERPM